MKLLFFCIVWLVLDFWYLFGGVMFDCYFVFVFVFVLVVILNYLMVCE